ncbi:hypothetical protein OGH69_17635 [Flavobacterium sp. MFBS3-15]|uniref:hypothetical protein n=1 Tax=Flavobacterium sp. MFBS3-15 TaxID=2989816 RepID=UPI0022369B8E|nr:hypothetical protein [Flavobacterium sp. MFBS3-15]MCW4470798.1 hypothetical protein [Flavobacterium sp. MFBS3-15]
MKYLYLSLCLALIACSDEPEALKSAQGITGELALEPVSGNVPADDYSYAEVSAVITGRRSPGDRIIFSAESGLFANGQSKDTVVAATDETVKVYLKHNRAGRVKVTATAFGKSKEVFVDFTPAYPDLLVVNPDNGTLPSEYTSTSLITTYLIRNTGTASQGQWISYRDSVATAEGGSIGTFTQNTQSDAEGNATVRYWVQDTAYHGFVYIKGEIQTPAGVRKGENRIYID